VVSAVKQAIAIVEAARAGRMGGGGVFILSSAGLPEGVQEISV